MLHVYVRSHCLCERSSNGYIWISLNEPADNRDEFLMRNLKSISRVHESQKAAMLPVVFGRTFSWRPNLTFRSWADVLRHIAVNSASGRQTQAQVTRSSPLMRCFGKWRTLISQSINNLPDDRTQTKVFPEVSIAFSRNVPTMRGNHHYKSLSILWLLRERVSIRGEMMRGAIS